MECLISMVSVGLTLKKKHCQIVFPIDLLILHYHIGPRKGLYHLTLLLKIFSRINF